MARYIDADKIPYYLDTSEEAPMEGRQIAFKSDIEKIPTADVAPRAEVAREIFEEIEEEIVAALESNYRARSEQMAKDDLPYELIALINGKINALRGIEGFVEELKKKYTEGEK